MEVLRERYGLCCGRIKEIAAAQEVAEEYRDYFEQVAGFILQVSAACDNRDKDAGLEELREENRGLYEDILAPHYAESYANPTYTCGKYGLEMGRLLS